MKLKNVLIVCFTFSFWGTFPLYFDLLRDVNHWEILNHRIIWSSVFITLALLFIKKIHFRALLITLKKHYLVLLFTALLISANWLIFVYAVLNNQVLETSLGYFISPLFSIFLGLMVFKEKLNKKQKIALILAFLAVIFKISQTKGIPWIPLGLALTFSTYGAIHKNNRIPSDVSLTLETWLLLPLSLLSLYFLGFQVELAFSSDFNTSILLVISGIMTLIPLLLFIYSTKHLELSKVGFFTYLTPCVSFLIGTLYFNETLNTFELISFVLIWIALIIISIDSIKKSNK